MNSANLLSCLLDGSLLKEIVEALLDAFTTKIDLEMMLLFQLEVKLDNIALGDNYKGIVFKVVNDFESKGSLAELINKARQDNSGNYKLQSVAKKINDIASLIEILVALEKDFLHQMKEAYLDCCSDSLREDWEDESPDTLKDILTNLKNTPQGKALESPIIQFVARLSENIEISENAAKKLKKWGEQNANKFSEVLTQIRNSDRNRQEQQIIKTYFIVLLNPSKQYQNKRYFVSAWFIRDGGNEKFNHQTGEGYKFLENREYEQETFTLEQIPSLLEYYLEQINSYLTDSSSEPTIEIFLPYELLNEPIDTWIIEQEEVRIPIGGLYKVIVRSSRRLDKKYPRNRWVQKWKTLEKLTEKPCSECCTSGEDYSSDELIFQLKLDDCAVALKLMNPLSQEIFRVLNLTGIPIALWLRQKLENLNHRVELNELLTCSITELPEQVTRKRLCDLRDNNEQRIGHHLSLLWENPYILPPQIEYTTPS